MSGKEDTVRYMKTSIRKSGEFQQRAGSKLVTVVPGTVVKVLNFKIAVAKNLWIEYFQ
jgi:hypothetical protein